MTNEGPERRSGEDRRQKDRRHQDRRKHQRRAGGADKPLFEIVPQRRKKSDRRTGVDRRQGQRRQWVRRRSNVRGLEEKLDLRYGLYFLREQVVGLPEGPYCTRCLDLDRKLVPIGRNIDWSRKLAAYTCPRCGSEY
jgi:hypothetical protein